ncbi:MFS transporter [Cupriavidus sp. CuC1]|uniref:MFS transporter n=1 Tax=Cupriavidus sp. CuC1 TaxID=3373131 RepID=UPI0037CD21FD
MPSPTGLPVLFVLLLGGFVTVFDLFVVNVAIPAIQADLGASFSEVGAVVAAYELAYGVLLIIGSRLGDLHGRRRLFVLGMAGFTLTSALCGVAPTPALLIAARVLQGAAAALLFPQIYAVIRVSFDDAARRRAFGLLGMTLGLAAIAGQVLGGLLVQSDLFGLGWRLIFLINVPVGAAAMLAARRIPESRAVAAPGLPASGLDWPGVLLASAGLTLLLVPLLEGPARGWPGWAFASLALAAAVLAGFVRVERHRPAPLVDLALFAQRRFALGTLVVLLVYSTASAFFLCFALLLQAGLGVGPLLAGSVFAPASVGFVAASMWAPRLVARFGNAVLAVAALLYAAAHAALTLQVVTAGATLVPWHLVPALILFGLAQGMLMTPLLNLVLGLAREAQAGMASGLVSTMQQVGGAFGIAIAGMFFQRALQAEGGIASAQRYAHAFAGAMGYNLAAALLCALLLLALARPVASPAGAVQAAH